VKQQKNMNTIHAPQISVSLEFEFMGTDLTAEYMISDEGITILFSSDGVESAKSITLFLFEEYGIMSRLIFSLLCLIIIVRNINMINFITIILLRRRSYGKILLPGGRTP